MGKKRIHELAKELSLSSAELIQKITEWNLVAVGSVKASSGLEDYQVDEVMRRLGVTPAGAAGAAPVVRRRKKVVEEGEAENATAEGAAEESAESAAGETAPQAEEQPVKIRPKGFEAATIIKPPQPPAAREAIAPAASQSTPDFIRRLPVESAAPEARPQAAAESPAPGAPTSAESERALEPSAAPTASASAAPQEPGAPAPETPAVPRRVTHELGEAAKIISPPAKGRFESARVIGSKPNWKEAPGGQREGGYRPGGTGGPGGPREGGYRPGGTGGPGGPREGGYRPGGTGGPGQGGFNKDKDAERPGAPARRPGGAPNFRTPRPAEPVPIPETDTRRRDNKKKKGGHAEGGEDGSKGARRRELVERTDLYAEGSWERVRGRKGKNVKKLAAKTEITVPKAIKRRIKVDEVITVSELAQRLAIKAGDIIKKLMSMGVLASLNQALDFDTATLVASEFGYEVEKASFDEGDVLPVAEQDDAPRATRPPVVTIMGHVDHGKTSLLDYIRKTNIQSGEAGGITQHIGAYHVTANGRDITFLDTPGHEAFTAMRSRGAQVTDIVILIVAADDGVMPQTREAADHARAAKVPIIVAINKIDKPAADPERIRRQMMEIGLVSEEWGGDTVFVEISAKSGQGIPELMDMILLQADIMELQARPDGLARGRIIEARLDKGRGPVATVLVQEGLLKQGDPYVCGVFYGKIRALLDDQGQRVTEAGPAIPVEIQGISGVPQAGDEFIVLEDEKQARQVSQHRLLRQRESELTKTSKLTLENLFDKVKAGAVRGLNLVIKTDVQGSLEAIVDAVSKLSTPEIKINIIHQSTGSVSETDVLLASASSALIVCFGVRPNAKVQEAADAEQVQIRYYDVIYKLLDDIKEAMAGLFDPVKSEKVLGRAEVRQTFMVTKVGMIAGSYVTDGKLLRGAKARLVRDGVVVHDGRIGSLKRLKDDVREVAHGYECGIGLDNYNDVKVGDVIEAYQIEETAATVELVDEALARAAKAQAEQERQEKLAAEQAKASEEQS